MDLIRRPIHPRVQRRRALAASLHIPPEMGAKFTEGEMAVLKVIADKHGRHGACTLTRDAIGDVSGTSRGTVKRAVRTAAAEGLIEVRPAFGDVGGVAGSLRRRAPERPALVASARSMNVSFLQVRTCWA
jgi:DNA-binding MarR family transcriptional regulator